MKIALLTLVLFVGGSAFADSKISVDDITVLPALENATVVVDIPGPMLAVQPTAEVNFDLTSCAKQSFEAQVTEANGVMLVRIQKVSLDCHNSHKVSRKYSVQISSDMNPNMPVILLNPVATQKK